MKHFPSIRPLLRRCEALLVTVGVLWAVFVTAGSQTASAAVSSLVQSLPLQVLRWELGDLQTALSPALVLTIAEAPALLAAREEVTRLWSTEPDPPPEEPAPQTQARPVEEAPLEVPPAAPPQTPSAPDNGVTARTLVPTDPSGYTVCGRVYISNSTAHTLSPPQLLEPFSAHLTGEGPQVLILHTHGSEAYTPAEADGIVWSGDHRTTDARYNVVRVGDAVADALSAEGISVLHDRTLYDYPNYSGAYDRSLRAVQSYLAQYPSIQFVLDVHRDAIEDGEGRQYKVISPLDDGSAAAQLSLVVGSDGSGLPHPHWMDNLRLAVALQEEVLTAHPTLMRPLLLRNSRYNQHAAPGALIVEVGAAGNSPEEALLAGALFGTHMAQLLQARSK